MIFENDPLVTEEVIDEFGENLEQAEKLDRFMQPPKQIEEENLLKSIGKNTGRGRNTNDIQNITGAGISTLPTGIGGFGKKKWQDSREATEKVLAEIKSANHII